MTELIRIHPDNPDERRIRQVVDVLRKGGIIIYPTDTVYGIGCDINHPKAIEQIARIKNLDPKKASFALICYDLSHLSEYAKGVDTEIFKLMKKTLPGPYTFILEASSKVPKQMNQQNKKEIGIRIPNHKIPRCIVKELNNPILTSSIIDEDEILEYSTDPELIYEKYKDRVDIVIDGGYGNNVASTVVNCTTGKPEVIREGLGPIDVFL